MRKIWLATLVVVLAALAMWSHWPVSPLAPGARADLLVVRKAARRLDLYQGGALLKSYAVSLGRHPIGPKQQQGDGKTPEGEYTIDYRKPDSSFYRALHISYPSRADRVAARSRSVEAGGLVMVHGMKNGLGWLGRLHLAVDWTDGCIAVTDHEIDEIWRAVPDGTRIVLRP